MAMGTIVNNAHGKQWQCTDNAEPEMTYNHPTKSTICVKLTVCCFGLPLKINFQHFHWYMCKTTESDRLTINAIVNIFHGKKFKHGRITCSISRVAIQIEIESNKFKNIYLKKKRLNSI